jgi:hypothetical protein
MDTFQSEWATTGPTVAGLEPTEATERLRKFQKLFDVRACLRHARLHACPPSRVDRACIMTAPHTPAHSRERGHLCLVWTDQAPRRAAVLAPQARRRRWQSCTSWEGLLGLAVSKYPQLERFQEEITLLDQLYRCDPSLQLACLPRASHPGDPASPLSLQLSPCRAGLVATAGG